MQVTIVTMCGIAFAVFATISITPAFSAETATCSSSTDTVTLSSNGPGSTMSISMFNGDSGSLPASNCSLTIKSTDGRLLSLTFDVIDTRPCEQDSLTIYTESSNKSICGNYKCPNNNCPNTTFSNTANVTVEYLSKDEGKRRESHRGFHGTITAYSLMDPKSKSCPGDNRFKCANNRCIWEGLHCDGQNHCGDNSDEPPGCAKTMWGVLVIVLGVVAVCFFLPLFCYLAIWGPRRKVPIRIMGSTFFRGKQSSNINDEESVPILIGQPVQGTVPGETYTFYYGSNTVQNPRC